MEGDNMTNRWKKEEIIKGFVERGFTEQEAKKILNNVGKKQAIDLLWRMN